MSAPVRIIHNTSDYISLLRGRAEGRLPDMGCALRVSALIKDVADGPPEAPVPVDILDVGCGAGHFYATFLRQHVPVAKYVGLEIDPGMVDAARDVWAAEVKSGAVEFLNQDLETFAGPDTYDVVICINAFMYFASAATALANLMRVTRRHLIIRSYFADSNYRIVRAQTAQNHDKAPLNEIDVFDDDGNIRCYDFWNIYSYSYIEALVAKIDPRARVVWLDDENLLASVEEERALNVHKRGATEVVAGQEVSYPFILPWKYLWIRVDHS